MKKLKEKIKSHLPSKRKIIQLYAALLFNSNLKGFGSGRIYQGKLKGICTPGLNCYSCPGATGACPLGSLQNALTSANKSLPFYMFGILMLYGLMFGRFICGFLCPFGLIQELLYKIKTPKIKKNRFTRLMTHFKYVLLGVFVFGFPILYAFKDKVVPGFCKYICPAGTFEGALGLLFNKANSDLYPMLSGLFTWKFVLLVWFFAFSVVMYRFFCRFFCPLGAIYGFFNKFALFGIKFEKSKCVECGKCLKVCKMDIRHVGDRECINCGECISVCPTKAISWKKGKITLAPNDLKTVNDVPEIDLKSNVKVQNLSNINTVTIEKSDTKTSDDVTPNASGCALTKKNPENKLNFKKAILPLFMVLVLVTSLIYFNFIDKSTVSGIGSEVGNECIAKDIAVVGSDKIFNVGNNKGKVTVINFWGTWCGPCVEELPIFSELAKEYGEQAEIIAIHSEYKKETVAGFIEKYYKDSKMLFGIDENSEYYSLLGGKDVYPMTVIVGNDGKIVAKHSGKITYEMIKEGIIKGLE